jgi:hypothetical protein
MFKQRMIKLMLGLALLAVMTGSAGIGADTLGLSATAQVHACGSGGGSGGGC